MSTFVSQTSRASQSSINCTNARQVLCLISFRLAHQSLFLFPVHEFILSIDYFMIVVDIQFGINDHVDASDNWLYSNSFIVTMILSQICSVILWFGNPFLDLLISREWQLSMFGNMNSKAIGVDMRKPNTTLNHVLCVFLCIEKKSWMHLNESEMLNDDESSYEKFECFRSLFDCGKRRALPCRKSSDPGQITKNCEAREVWLTNVDISRTIHYHIMLNPSVKKCDFFVYEGSFVQNWMAAMDQMAYKATKA
jgi:hypothetical protein